MLDLKHGCFGRNGKRGGVGLLAAVRNDRRCHFERSEKSSDTARFLPMVGFALPCMLGF